MKSKNNSTPIQQDRAKAYSYANGDVFKGKSMAEIFSTILRERTWNEYGSRESVSGSGSSNTQTRTITKALPVLLEQYKIQTVLDIPCGDFHWMKQLDWNIRSYTGADIIEDLIVQHNTRYKKDNIRFMHKDLTKDPLQTYDLIICRDCLVHFSFEDILRAIQNIKRSKSHYLLTTTFTEQIVNEDITTGGWRPVNLEKAPFHFPKPLTIINERCTEMNGIFRDKSLGLWKIKDL